MQNFDLDLYAADLREMLRNHPRSPKNLWMLWVAVVFACGVMVGAAARLAAP